MRRDPVRMTQSEWESELRQLRSDLGPTRPMKLKWRRKTPLLTGRSGLDALLGRTTDDEAVVLTLYATNARAGDRPVAEVAVPLDANVEHIEQGRIVEVAGRAEPGHAAVVIIDEEQYWPIYPCTLGVRPPRL